MKTKDKKLKTYTLNQIKDEMIGKRGTPGRDEYEFELNLDLSNGYTAALTDYLRNGDPNERPQTITAMKKVISICCLSVGIFLGTAFMLTANAQNVTHRIPMFENDQVKVWETIIVPNSPLSMHRHEHGRTIVVLKGGTLTIQQDTGEKKKLEWKTGQAYWLDADPPGTKQHADVNETNEPIDVMVIENKKGK